MCIIKGDVKLKDNKIDIRAYEDMAEVMKWLRANLPPYAILTNGAGNFTVWPNKFYLFGENARLLAPQSGAMGYGLPAAIAAKRKPSSSMWPELQSCGCWVALQIPRRSVTNAGKSGAMMVPVIGESVLPSVNPRTKLTERTPKTRTGGARSRSRDFNILIA